MLIDASAPLVAGDTALLNSERLTPTAGFACLSFWYHMYGSGIGQLRVLIDHGIPNTHEIDDDQKQFPIWVLSGEQGNEWRKAQVMWKKVIKSTYSKVA